MNALVDERAPLVEFQDMIKLTMELLRDVPDFRGRKGRQFELGGVLAVVVLALAAGKSSLAEVARFAKRRKDLVRALGLRRAPSHPTIWRAVTGVDRGAMRKVLKRVGGEMLQGRLEVAAAIDAKTMRGSREGTGKSAELVTAVEHSTGVVLDAVMTGGQGNELKTGRKLAKELLKERSQVVVVTGDALYADHDLAQEIITEAKDYAFKLKKTSRSFSMT